MKLNKGELRKSHYLGPHDQRPQKRIAKGLIRKVQKAPRSKCVIGHDFGNKLRISANDLSAVLQSFKNPMCGTRTAAVVAAPQS